VYTTLEHPVAVDPAWSTTTPPPVGRLAVRLGAALVRWGQEHALRTDRREQARRNGAALAAEADRLATGERRFVAGPRW
jgi:hypothetical protein